ncbi:MAG: TIGR02186 family protein [Hyphomicrobiales bacterium]|nr:TIGR02186 family protein [Alphaproteobacteria bacterium]
MTGRLTIAAAALFAGFLAGTGPAAAERLVTSISRHQVLVNSSFTGTSIVLFGTVEPDSPTARRATAYDLIVTVSGPKQIIVERRKERVLGIWANMASRTFLNVPSYLAVLSNQPVEQIANADTVRTQQLGLADKLLPQQLGNDVADVVRDDPFRTNFIRLKTRQNLYLQRANGVTLLTPTVFRAEISLPAVAPIGNYDVDVKAFADGVLLTRANSAFEVVKVGFEQFVATAAQDYGLVYGLTTAMMAIMTGWFAAVVFRRD